MNNSLPLEHIATEKTKKSLAYLLGFGLGKVVVSVRHKLSDVSQAIHHRIEDDVQKRLAAQEEYHDMLSQQQEIAYCEEMERLKRRYLKITLGMTLIGLLMGFISSTILFWYY